MVDVDEDNLSEVVDSEDPSDAEEDGGADDGAASKQTNSSKNGPGLPDETGTASAGLEVAKPTDGLDILEEVKEPKNSKSKSIVKANEIKEKKAGQ